MLKAPSLIDSKTRSPGKMDSAYFYAEFDSLDITELTLGEKESHHAAMVRRVRLDEEIFITNGKGLVAHAAVTANKKLLTAKVTSVTKVPQPLPNITVLQSVLKGDRNEFAVELMSEVGVSQIIFWEASRSVPKKSNHIKTLNRWNDIAISACKQSRSAWFPKLDYLNDLKLLDSVIRNFANPVVLNFGAEAKLIDQKVSNELLLIVGPEGGLTVEELEVFKKAGAISANIGNTVLRGSSAGAIAAALSFNVLRRDHE